MEQFYQTSLDAFAAIMNSPSKEIERSVSTRIKILIKNMLEEQKKGWPKLREKQTSELKTKADIEAQARKELQDAEAARRQNDEHRHGGGGYRGDRGDHRDNRKDLQRAARRDSEPQHYQQRRDGGDQRRGGGGDRNYRGDRGDQRQGDRNQYQQRGDRGGDRHSGSAVQGEDSRRDNNRQSQSKPAEPHTPEELQKKVLKLFKQFCGQVEDEEESKSETKEFNFNSITDLQRHTVEKDKKQQKIFGEDILMALFQKIVDLPADIIKEKLGDFLQNLIEKSNINTEGWKKSVQQIVPFLENIVSEFADDSINEVVADMIKQLLRKEKLKVSEILWF